MRSTRSLGFLLAAGLVAAIAFATPRDQTNPRAELHPRGELSAEQIARTAAEPPQILQTQPTVFPTAEADLVRAIHDAKRSGDKDAMALAEEALAAFRGESLSFLESSSPPDDEPRVTFGGDEGTKWLPHEFLLAGGEFPEDKPSLASDTAGNLYAAFEREVEPDLHQCVVFQSADGGEHWGQLFFIHGVDVVSPSLEIAEGAENWLFLTFHNQTGQAIHVYRWNLDTPPMGDMQTLMVNVPGVSNPRLVVDDDEYAGWYAYLVFNAAAVDNWVFLHTRTLDYGATWTDPEIIGGYCGYPGAFYDATVARPDIEFGSLRLHIAFDNYPSPCTVAQRDIFLLTSQDYGASWGTAVQLTTQNDDEHDPAVATVKHHGTARTTMVAYTRFYNEMDDDVWYTYTHDDGLNWSTSHCIACSTPQERSVNLATSPSQGFFHAAFWDEANLDYAIAPYDSPVTWVREDSLVTLNNVVDDGIRPGLLVDPTRDPEMQAGIAWTDNRNNATASLDIFYEARDLPHQPVDYYLYSSLNPGVGAVCGMDGFVDHAGAIEGIPGAEYLFFTGGQLYEGDITAYVYRVETAGDPQMHPDNPENPGPVAARTFTLVGSHYMGYYANAHDNAFYIDESGIYYGPSNNSRNGVDGWATFMGGAIWHWDFEWNLLGCVVTDPPPAGNQTLARNPMTGHWWAGRGGRLIHRWDGTSWQFIFGAPHLGGSHHDGLEVIGNSLYVSDMTSDAIMQYRLDDAGDLLDPPGSPTKTHFYSHSPAVEGMGFGPNQHIWVTSGGATFYEVGGGALLVAFDGIPDQCALPGQPFEPFDLDNFVAGTPPYSWSWEGNASLTITVDAENVVMVTYPPGWVGREEVTFIMTDALNRVASDQAIFTVSPIPVVGDIPNQVAPFVPFDLDDYLLAGEPELIHWTATSTMCLEVEINPVTHVATVINPGGCTVPEWIMFTAVVPPCEGMMHGEDEALFDPGLVGVETETLTAFSLGAPTPNPCTSSTEIGYSIPTNAGAGSATLAVYDVAGHLIRTLVDDSARTGRSFITWDGRTDKGQPAPSGVYFFQLRWRDRFECKRVVVLR